MRIDTYVHLLTLVVLIGAIMAAASWIGSVDAKLSSVAVNAERLDKLEREVLTNREATYENRKVGQAILDKLK